MQLRSQQVHKVQHSMRYVMTSALSTIPTFTAFYTGAQHFLSCTHACLSSSTSQTSALKLVSISPILLTFSTC